jgi:hypothetical protein
MNLFIKSLPLAIFDKCVKDIGMRRRKDLQGLFIEMFLMRQYAHKYMSVF